MEDLMIKAETATEETPDNDDDAKQEDQPERQTRQIEIDEADMSKSYANFCRVIPGYEELLVDFGLSPQPIGAQQPQTKVKLDQRVIVNYFMAKRLLHLLNGAVQRYESIFGVLETDIQKRVKPQKAGN
jgi:hypothetical protein